MLFFNEGFYVCISSKNSSKVQNYTPTQLESLAKKFIELAGIGCFIGDSMKGLDNKMQSKRIYGAEFEAPISTKDNTISYREVNYKGRRINAPIPPKEHAR